MTELDENQTNGAATAALVPGSIDWRITIATLAHRFFALIRDGNTAKLIGQPADSEQTKAWSVAYFQLYLQKSGIPTGEGFAVSRILGAMERVGLLMNAGWRADMVGLPLMGQLYISQGVRSAQTAGNLWLSEALGPDLIIQSYKAVTVQVGAGEGKPAGTGLVLDRSHIVTNRHVIEALVGHGVSGDIEIHTSFKPPAAGWISRPSRVHARLDVDVAVIEAELGENEGILALSGIAFRDPKWDDELRVFGYPFTLGFTEQPFTVEHGHVVNPAGESPAVDGNPRHKIFLTSAIERPGNSGGPIVAQDGSVIGLVIDHTRGARSARAGTVDTQQESNRDLRSETSESSPFYRGIPASEVVRAIEELGFTGLATLENPA